MTFTTLLTAHICGPKPDLPAGSVIRCDECGTKYERRFLGWIPVEETTPDSAAE